MNDSNNFNMLNFIFFPYKLFRNDPLYWLPTSDLTPLPFMSFTSSKSQLKRIQKLIPRWKNLLLLWVFVIILRQLINFAWARLLVTIFRSQWFAFHFYQFITNVSDQCCCGISSWVPPIDMAYACERVSSRYWSILRNG